MYGQLISSVTVGAGGASSISFSAIPATFTDLCLVLSPRMDGAATVDELYLSFNGSTSGFTRRSLRGDGSSVVSNSQSFSNYMRVNAASNTANTFSNVSIYIPNYTGSTYKSISVDSVQETNATQAWQMLSAGLWSNTAAITSISIDSNSVYNFVQYSTAYLYGLTKGSGGATVS